MIWIIITLIVALIGLVTEHIVYHALNPLDESVFISGYTFFLLTVLLMGSVLAEYLHFALHILGDGLNINDKWIIALNSMFLLWCATWTAISKHNGGQLNQSAFKYENLQFSFFALSFVITIGYLTRRRMDAILKH